jgi:hypothetical protein
MSKQAFDKLVSILSDVITVNEMKSRASTNNNDPIRVEYIVAIGLRYLGGEYLKTIRDVFGLSPSSTKRALLTFLDAVLNCKALDIHVPIMQHELKEKADEFYTVSSMPGKMFHGCVGAIDGWLPTINKPNVNNDADYRSGHYNCFGLNVQALCDASLKFIFIEVAAPGRTNDIRAYRRCRPMKDWIDQLPDGYFVVGDSAYPLSNHLLIPFSGTGRYDQHKSAYNYYLSQLRTRIEMAFGRMTSRWRVFHRNLDCTLPVCSKIILAAARLHNYIIDNDGQNVIVDPKIGNGDEIIYNRTINDDDDDDGDGQPLPTTHLRDTILAQVIAMDLRRPS